MAFSPSISTLLLERPVIDPRSMPVDLQMLIDGIRHQLSHRNDLVPELHSIASSTGLPAPTIFRTLAVVPSEEAVCRALDSIIHAITCHQVEMWIGLTLQRRGW